MDGLPARIIQTSDESREILGGVDPGVLDEISRHLDRNVPLCYNTDNHVVTSRCTLILMCYHYKTIQLTYTKPVSYSRFNPLMGRDVNWLHLASEHFEM